MRRCGNAEKPRSEEARTKTHTGFVLHYTINVAKEIKKQRNKGKKRKKEKNKK